MEQKDSENGTEDPLEMSSEPQSSEKDDSKINRDLSEGKPNNKEQGDSKDTDNPLGVSSYPQSSENDDSKKDIDPPKGHLSDMELGDSKECVGNPSKVFSNPHSLEKDDSMKDTDPTEEFIYNTEQGDSNMGTENPVELLPNPLLSEKDESKKDKNPPDVLLQNIEQGDNNDVTENPIVVFSNPQLSEKDDSKKDTDPPDACLHNIEKGDSKNGTENPPEVFGNPQSPEMDVSKDRDSPEGSGKPESSHKRTARSLKAKSKVVKKSQPGKTKAKMNKGSLQIRGRKRNGKNTKVVGNADSSQNENEKQVSDDNQQMKSNDELHEKSEGDEKIQEVENQNEITTDKSPIEENQTEKTKSRKKQKNKKKRKDSIVGSRSRSNKDKHSGMEKSQSKEKRREKLGGLIFMCNTKTKPDCFRYRVMGVSAGKKDVVLGVKPGLKLFLYDFDLKLLYGIYKASSSGGMKIEPRAFGGKFPAQVRFNISSDCFPLPENIFKKAIKENYNEKNKFKTELTARQVRRLTELFRPVGIRSALPPSLSPRKSSIQDRELESSNSVRGSLRHRRREIAAGDPYIQQPYERDLRIERREEVPRDLFLTDSYRAYGALEDRRNVISASHYGALEDRRNVISASHVNPMQDPYGRDYEHLHERDAGFRSNVPSHVRADHLYLNEREHQNYVHGGILDRTWGTSYAYGHGASPRDACLPPLDREAISSRSYLVGGRTLIRRETDYDRMLPYHGDTSPVRVSSRYSFAGPSFSHR